MSELFQNEEKEIVPQIIFEKIDYDLIDKRFDESLRNMALVLFNTKNQAIGYATFMKPEDVKKLPKR